MQSARDLDQVLGRLITDLRRMGRRILVVSEYGIEPVHRPIRINQVLRKLGQVAFRLEEGGNIWIRESQGLCRGRSSGGSGLLPWRRRS